MSFLKRRRKTILLLGVLLTMLVNLLVTFQVHLGRYRLLYFFAAVAAIYGGTWLYDRKHRDDPPKTDLSITPRS
jgi:hypothetical protein